jgi:aminoglycoside 2'-N-acetyltransferase I
MSLDPIARLEVLSADIGWKMAKPLFDEVWPPEVVAKLPWKDVQWSEPQRRVLAFDRAGALIGHAEFLLRDADWENRAVRVVGIGGVVTRPDRRRRGIASAVVRRAIEEAVEADFGLLFCEPRHAPVYEKLGWRRFGGDIFAMQPHGRIRFAVTDPYVLDRKLAPRAGIIDLRGYPW